MNSTNKDIEILSPINQLNLYGYESYFNFFVKLFEKGKIPNSLLLSGPKGLGKSTFAYHLINYLLSKNEEKEYSVSNHSINQDNYSYKLLNNKTHPNFFLIKNNLLNKDIKVDQIRDLSKFLNKSTYRKDLKIVLIDNAEFLNLNSSNALLKALEEPADNTYFFLIHDSASKILDTIKSRCIEFRFFFTTLEKNNIFENIIKQYKKEFIQEELKENLYFDTPGNLIRYFQTLNNVNINIKDNKIDIILFLIEKYKKEKNFEILKSISFFIELFYRELCINNNNLNKYLVNQSKILQRINDMKKFNLDEKNVFVWIMYILKNERI